MRWVAAILLLILCLSLIAPVSALYENRYSYISVNTVTVHLEEKSATIDVDYTIDDEIQLLVSILGRTDLNRKVMHIINYDNARIQQIDMTHARLIVDNASNDYGAGSFWFPSHQFGVTIPDLEVTSPQTSKNFTSTAVFPKGMGYFGAEAPPVQTAAVLTTPLNF
ncbi:hypothetical protein [Methanosphaerula palustris]|uniref:Uncharacterized protein n=1 Tax=Methanosphaerula palustris (strain ATCC BAA-1556 / DSM 19958 / E1-9c) TaxID=521011 RepID=B8GDS3_METPE|nr:hypothetical protein [Methanosphaerula palustris]ACL17424.1 conserved hypothetical protein [Methanosphaerula palustris E1-9c]